MLYCVSVWPWACRFGGTVNLKYCSAIFCGDDAFDTDQGYQGKMQFLFCMVGTHGHHCTEMDSDSKKPWNAKPRSFPQMYGATFVGGGATLGGGDDALMRLREGTGGEFANIIITHGTGFGVKNDKCGAEKHIQALPDASVTYPDYIMFSRNNIVYGARRS